jgi:hypothetical protein
MRIIRGACAYAYETDMDNELMKIMTRNNEIGTMASGVSLEELLFA